MKRTQVMIIAALVAVVLVLKLFMFQVRQSQVAVVTAFGKVVKTKDTPGPGFKWPPPIYQVYTFDQRIQNFEDKYDESLTADNYNLLSMAYVGWRISDAQAFFPKFPHANEGAIPAAEQQLERFVRSAKTAVIGKHPLSDFVSTNPKALKFAEIESEILKQVQNQLDTQNYGIKMEYLGFKKLGFPESVTSEVFKLMQSERAKLISKISGEGESEAASIRAAADSKSAQMLANADAEATRIKSQGVAAAADSFAIFQQNPDLAKFLLDLNAMEASLKSRATLIFDQHTEPFNLFQGYTTNQDNKK